MAIPDTAAEVLRNYLPSYACVPLLKEFATTLQAGDLGRAIAKVRLTIAQLRDVNEAIRSHESGESGARNCVAT